MTATTATFDDVTPFDRPTLYRGNRRRVIRLLFHGVVISLGTGAAICALVATVTVAAAWIVGTALATNPKFNAKAPNGPVAIALANGSPTFAGASDVTELTDVTDSADVSSDPLDAPTFEAKWAPTMPSGSMRRVAVELVPPPPERPSKLASLQPAGQAVPQGAAATSENSAARQEARARSMALTEPDGRTAVYDIAAHTVYLPNGKRLEAHSGLGDKLDDPRYVSVKDRGPTPPNVYDLALREGLFHEVQAIRLKPVGDDRMFGRDGILAHPYMLGANGQSNGCVSFKDYPAFLHAYLRGEVQRLVVVPRLGDVSWRTASARASVRGNAESDP